MAEEWGLTEAGYVAPRGADFLTRIRDGYIERVRENTGLTITVDWDHDVFLGPISDIMADLLGELGEASQALFDSWDVGNATGLQLDNLCLIVNVRRREATYSTCTVTITGTAGTIITEGRIVEGGGSDDRARWTVTEDVTIGGGGTVDVIVQASDPGVIEADVAEIVTIVTPVSGWTSVTNAAAATPGEARESDAALRKRRQQSLQTAGSRSLNALRANVLAADGVTAAVVVENDTSTTATIEGISCLPHSVAVVVYPSTLTDDQKTEVVQAIYDHLPAGIATNGAQTATVTGADGFAKTVRYDFAAFNTVNSAVTVTLMAGFVLDDVEEPIQELISDYFLALDVGEAASILQILALIATVDGVRTASVLLNGGAVDVDPSATSLNVLGTNTVST